MEEKLNNILNKITDLAVDTAVIRRDVSENTKDLAEHIRRTDLLENQVNKALTPMKWLKTTLAVAGGFAIIVEGARALLWGINKFGGGG